VIDVALVLADELLERVHVDAGVPAAAALALLAALRLLGLDLRALARRRRRRGGRAGAPFTVRSALVLIPVEAHRCLLAAAERLLACYDLPRITFLRRPSLSPTR
jgi:hypothetical protein